MISMAGISRLENAIQKTVETFESSPEFDRLAGKSDDVAVESPTREWSQRLDGVVSTLEIFIEAYRVGPTTTTPLDRCRACCAYLACRSRDSTRLQRTFARPNRRPPFSSGLAAGPQPSPRWRASLWQGGAVTGGRNLLHWPGRRATHGVTP